MPLSPSDLDELRTATRDVLTHHRASTSIGARNDFPAGFDEVLWKVGVELGWNSLSVPELYGGIELSVAEVCVVAEEFGRIAEASPLSATLGAALILSEFGPDEMKQCWLPRIVDGTAVMSWGMARGTSRPASTLTLREEGDGFVLDGSVEWLPDGPVATGFLVGARLGDRDVVVVLAADTRGVEIGRMRSLDVGRLYAKLECTGVSVSAESVLREGAAEALFNVAVTLQCAETLGLTRALLDMTVQYVSARVQFGQPIGKFQAVKHRITDMLVECEAARATTGEAASILAESIRSGAEAVSVAKSTTGRAGSVVASEALQLHGGIGFTWEHDLHVFLRRAKVNELLFGSPAWHEERLAAMVLDRVKMRT